MNMRYTCSSVSLLPFSSLNSLPQHTHSHTHTHTHTLTHTHSHTHTRTHTHIHTFHQCGFRFLHTTMWLSVLPGEEHTFSSQIRWIWPGNLNSHWVISSTKQFIITFLCLLSYSFLLPWGQHGPCTAAFSLSARYHGTEKICLQSALPEFLTNIFCFTPLSFTVFVMQ
jgi:hypothetical protein